MIVWAFNGRNSKFPSGIFTEKEIAETWIKKYRLSGILTQYPLDEGVYDWAILNGSFSVKNEEEAKPEFIQRFSSASQEHYHYKTAI